MLRSRSRRFSRVRAEEGCADEAAMEERGEKVPDQGVWVYGDCRLRALMPPLRGEGGIVRRAEFGPGRMNGEGGIMIRGLSGRARVRFGGCFVMVFVFVFVIDSVEPEDADEAVETEVVVVVESEDICRERADCGWYCIRDTGSLVFAESLGFGPVSSAVEDCEVMDFSDDGNREVLPVVGGVIIAGLKLLRKS